MGIHWTEDSEQFLINRLGDEWARAERAAKRHEVAMQIQEKGKAVGRVLLGLALLSGVITIAVVAPNVFSAFGALGRQRRFFDRDEARRSLYSLKQNSLVKLVKTGENSYRLSLTFQGRRRALREELERFRLQKTGVWDGVWRIVAFDIPRSHNKVRDILRYRLRMIGMEQLQESVFIYPYPCEIEVKFVASLHNAFQYIRFINATSIEDVMFYKGEIVIG